MFVSSISGHYASRCLPSLLGLKSRASRGSRCTIQKTKMIGTHFCVNAHHHHLFFSIFFSHPPDTSNDITRKQKPTFSSRECSPGDRVREHEIKWKNIRVVGNEKQKLALAHLAVRRGLFLPIIFLFCFHSTTPHSMSISIQYLFVDWNHAFKASDYLLLPSSAARWSRVNYENLRRMRKV